MTENAKNSANSMGLVSCGLDNPRPHPAIASDPNLIHYHSTHPAFCGEPSAMRRFSLHRKDVTCPECRARKRKPIFPRKGGYYKSTLTPQILALHAKGLRNAEISRILECSDPNVSQTFNPMDCEEPRMSQIHDFPPHIMRPLMVRDSWPRSSLAAIYAFARWPLVMTSPHDHAKEGMKMSEIIANPTRAAEIVCHEEQLTVWADDIISRLGMEEWLRDDLSYDDLVALDHAVRDEIKKIVESAFDHPEARTVLRNMP